ncbi:MAG: acyl-CoA dehydrogenase family protein [Thermoproteota archaeon]|jgi:acyl-CoA dehydrogenase|nr:acyl-CoA dehydrogenase family protein [Thermoproteota archaeon]
MEFELSEEERIFQETASEFLKKELRPIARKIDEEKRIPKDFIKKFASQGYLGLLNSPKYSGAGANMKMATILAEEIGKNDISLATAVFYLLNTAWSYILEKYGKEEVVQEVIPRLVKGEAFVGICSTEPSGGSDVASISTLAKKNGNNYYIEGEKIYISEVREILENDGGLLTLAKTKPELRHKGISMFFLPLKKLDNIEVSYLENMGRMGISTSIIRFKGSSVDEKYLIGEENKGFYYAMEGFVTARILVAASCIGAAEAVLERGIEYTKNRKAFGITLAKYEGIQFPMVDLYSRIEAVKLLIYKAAWLYDEMRKGKASYKEVTKYSAMSKLLAPKLAIETIEEVMTWLGGYGYTKEAEIEMALRGVISYYVGAEGAANIMRIIIGREILGKEFVPYKE